MDGRDQDAISSTAEPGATESDEDGRRFRSHVRWSYLLEGGRMAATTGVSFLLAALLDPAAFGVVAVGLVYTIFVQTVFQDPLILALVQRRGLSDDHKLAAFWLVMGASVLIGVVSVLGSTFVAELYGLPDLGPVLSLLALSVPLRGLAVVHEALLLREMQFKKITVRTHSSILAGGVVGISAALAGAGIWSLVAQHLTTTIVATIALWIVEEWRPRMRWSGSAMGDLAGFSSLSALSNVGVFLSNRCDILLMGYFFSPVAVGLYRLSFRLADTLLGVAARSMQVVSLPHLARLQDDPHSFSARYFGAQRLVALVGLPPLGLLAAVAVPLVRILGDAWRDAGPVLQVLCLAACFTAFSQLLGPLLQALDRPGLVSALSWIRGLGGVVAFIAVGIGWRDAPIIDQLLMSALVYAVLQAVVAVMSVVVVTNVARLDTWRQITLFLPAGVTAALAATVAVLREPLGLHLLPAPADLLATAAIATVVAGTTLCALDPGVRGAARRALSASRTTRDTSR